MIKDLLDDARDRMGKSIDATRHELATVRTGRASPHLLDRVQVDYYGTSTPLKQLANVAATEDVAPASPEVVAPTPDEPDTRFASNDEPASEAPAAAVAANDESGAEPDTPTATTEPQPVAAAQPAAAAQPIDEDLIERRRKRDAQLILSAQRRRRRTRGF